MSVGILGGGVANPLTAALNFGGFKGTNAAAPTTASGVDTKAARDAAITAAIAALPPAGGGEIDYAETTVQLAIAGLSTAGATQIVSGAAIIYDGATAVLIDVYIPDWLINGSSNIRLASVGLYEDGAHIGTLAIIQIQVGGITMRAPVRAARKLTPTAGAHTYSGRGWKDAAGDTVLSNCGAGGVGNMLPGYIRISHA